MIMRGLDVRHNGRSIVIIEGEFDRLSEAKLLRAEFLCNQQSEDWGMDFYSQKPERFIIYRSGVGEIEFNRVVARLGGV